MHGVPRIVPPPHSDVKQRIFHVEPGPVLSGCRLMTVITMMRCFLRPWVPSTHTAPRARKTHACRDPCVYTHERCLSASCVHGMYTTGNVTTCAHTCTRVRFINALRVGPGQRRGCNEKILNDDARNTTRYYSRVCLSLFILHYANYTLS